MLKAEVEMGLESLDKVLILLIPLLVRALLPGWWLDVVQQYNGRLLPGGAPWNTRENQDKKSNPHSSYNFVSKRHPQSECSEVDRYESIIVSWKTQAERSQR